MAWFPGAPLHWKVVDDFVATVPVPILPSDGPFATQKSFTRMPLSLCGEKLHDLMKTGVERIIHRRADNGEGTAGFWDDLIAVFVARHEIYC
jgi:hypothetical protein